MDFSEELSQHNDSETGQASYLQKDDERQYLLFMLQQEMFAIGILRIKEILEYGRLTPVPMVPDFIRGVINLRGAVVPVIDLSVRFGGSRSELNKRTCIVIIEVKTADTQQDIGVMVDSVASVLEIPPTDIEPPPAFGTAIDTDFIQGLGKMDDDFVIILDVDRVLSIEELAVVNKSASTANPQQLP